ncbi:tat pathway signal sequence [Gordonia sp. DT30]|uniref:tat pathway signal sequence n=1 Tax=unclassified Gordonia (in: high G+C Gram-positive bacteria) TaxID=2657482 RepID=UPI003CF483BB
MRRSLIRSLCAAVLASAAVVSLGSTQAHAAPGDDAVIAATLPARLAAADAYAASRPGGTGVVVLDRTTGTVYADGRADTPVWTASTIKLAMATDLLNRQRSGAITLSAADRADIHAMLHSSDDAAADRLWFAYSGTDHQAFNRDFRAFGMTALQPQRGFSSYYPYWGFQKDTPRDMARLVDYVLTRTAPDDRRYLVGEMRGVAADQQWGILSAPANRLPGNKNGWSDERGGSVMNSVGFAGEGQRFVVAIMNDLAGQGGQAQGKATVSQVARDLLG